MDCFIYSGENFKFLVIARVFIKKNVPRYSEFLPFVQRPHGSG